MIKVGVFDYVDVNGANLIKDWLHQQQPKVRAKLNGRIIILEQTSRAEWIKLNTEVLSGDKDGLIAIRVEYQGIQYRLLGYDGPNRGEFTLLACGEEHNNIYLPRNIGGASFDRIREIGKNPRARRVEHDYE